MTVDKLDTYLGKIKEQISKGVAPVPLTIRDLLNELNVARRGPNVIGQINQLLDKYDLVIDQDIEWYWIDNPINITDRRRKTKWVDREFSFRIDGLPSANTKPTSISPNDSIDVAITLMVKNNYSQVPVMTSEREVKGMVSWKTIARHYSTGNSYKTVSEVMEKPVIVDDETSIFDAIGIVEESDYVLIRNTTDKVIKGIVTTSDLADQFKTLSSPFLLVGRCENLVRQLISGVYTTDELRLANPNENERKDINSIYDLSFGDYIALIGTEERWKRLKVTIDRKICINLLDQVRTIRNDIMHFDPDNSYEKQISVLKEANRLLEFAIATKGAD